MKVVCAWCGAGMGKKGTEEGTTHGMCEKCFDKEMKKLDEKPSKG
jgi:hypothetical protein